MDKDGNHIVFDIGEQTEFSVPERLTLDVARVMANVYIAAAERVHERAQQPVDITNKKEVLDRQKRARRADKLVGFSDGILELCGMSDNDAKLLGRTAPERD